MTTNEMIYKTISTKLNKEPIYKSVLEDLGYKVYGSEWSSYNNWAVKNPKTNKMVVISKGYDNKKGLFDGPNCIRTNDIKKVNYVDLLNKDRSVKSSWSEDNYGYLKATIKEAKRMVRWYERANDEKQKQIDAIKDDIERNTKYLNEYKMKLDVVREKVNSLKKAHV